MDDAGNGIVNANQVNNNSSDACGVDTMYLDQTTFDCSEVGLNEVTLTLVDVNGNSSICTANITVEDNVPPDPNCQDVTIQLDASGNGVLSTNQVNNNSSDACGVDTMYLDQTTFDCSEVGINGVTLTVVDVNGNSSTCTADITIEDNVPPIANCQDLTIQLNASGNAFVNAIQVNNSSSDACGIDSIYLDQTTFDCSEVGVNEVILTAVDVNGNSSSCTATILVEDNVDPNALCQDATVQLDVTGTGVILSADIDNGSTDACGIDTLYLNNNSFDCDDVGLNLVMLIVTDINGNISSCESNVLVEDLVPPVALCQDILVQLDANGQGNITAENVDAGSTDACGIDSLILDPTQFDCSNVGPNNVTLTVIDVNGNASTCESEVFVEDNVAPLAVCQTTLIELDSLGTAVLFPEMIDGGSNDACGIDTLIVDPSIFDCSNVGINSVELTVIDVNGNTSNCTAEITVEDYMAPTALCQDVTIQLDINGLAIISVDTVDANSWDACGIASLSIDQDQFDCEDIGTNMVNLTVVDVNGNVSNCSSVVTIEDVAPPSLDCSNFILVLDSNGVGEVTVELVGDIATDACGVNEPYFSQDIFDCADVGENDIEIFVSDVNGNVSSCLVTVSVVDNINPTAICTDEYVLVGVNEVVTLTGELLAGSSYDNCGIDTLIVEEHQFSCLDVGENTLQIEVVDVNGNVSFCTSTILVEDSFNSIRDMDLLEEDFIVIELGEELTVIPNIPVFEGIDYVWYLDDTLHCGNCESVTLNPLFSSYLDLVIQDTFGCLWETDAVYIDVIIDSPVYIPNVFSPDNDGINDFFQVFHSNAVEVVEFMQIKDRWGNIVYSGNYQGGEEIQWDGRFLGQEMDPAVFLYEVLVRYINGEEGYFVGTVTLVR